MKPVDEYPAILFDVGGTLLHLVRDPHLTAIEAVAHLGAISAPDFAAAIRKVVADWRAGGGRPEVEDLPHTWVEHNRRALALIGFSGDIGAAAHIMEDVFLSDGLEVYPEVTEVLATFAERGFTMGVVSNWPARLESTLREMRLTEYFSTIVASGAVGYAKPHPRIFKIASDRLGIEPRQALYIGDSIDHDVMGAREVGMDVILLDRLGRHPSHASIRSLVELLEASSGIDTRSSDKGNKILGSAFDPLPPSAALPLKEGVAKLKAHLGPEATLR